MKMKNVYRGIDIMKKKLYQDQNGEYFLYKGKHYLNDIDSRGFDKNSFSSSGKYTGYFKVTGFGKTHVIVEETFTTFKMEE